MSEAVSDGNPREGSRKLPGLATHYLRYSISNVFVLVAGLVSFPILTRLLDNTQYGILGYYDTWVLIAIAVAKLGAQHAIVRFYPFDRDPRHMTEFGTNLVVLPLLMSLGLWAVVALSLVAAARWGGNGYPPVFWCVVVLTPLMVFNSIVQMVVRASERSDLVMITRVAGRWLEVGLVVAAVFALQRSALAVYGGKIAAAVLLAAYFIHWARRNVQFNVEAIDTRSMRAALAYGMPLMANELVVVILVAIDRVMLRHMTGDFAMVGIYTIGYALASKINIFMNSSLTEAFGPVVNRTYETGGADEVRRLKDKVLLPMTYASVAIAVMLVGVGPDLLVALSGPGKAASGPVFVVVGVTLALFPLFDISSYGLLLRKRSLVVFAISALAMGVNVGINLILIPRFGYMGAAWATFISYVVLCAARYLFCPPGLARLPDTRTMMVASGSALLLLVAIKGSNLFGLDSPWLRLGVAGFMFMALYALPVWCLDGRLRHAVLGWARRR